MKVGLISDTHGLLRMEAVAALRGCDHIIHGGDIGKPEILAALQSIANVTAVRGNNDRASWADRIPGTATLEIAGARVFVIHDVKELDIDPGRENYAAVVSGHSHKPRLHEEGGVLFVNPGSAGPRRFKLPVSVGFLRIARGEVRGEVLEL